MQRRWQDGCRDLAQIGAAIGATFAAGFGVDLVEGALGPEEAAAARALAGSKYQSAVWTQRLAPAIA